MKLLPGNGSGFPKMFLTERQDFSIDCIPADDEWATYAFPSLRLKFHTSSPDVICEATLPWGSADPSGIIGAALYPIYRKELSRGGFPVHAALFAYKEQGFLLVAASGTGKSTCCSRIAAPWNALCDEEALVVLHKENTYSVHPFPTIAKVATPFHQHEWDVQQNVPLRALLFLEQSDDDAVLPIRKAEAAALLQRGIMDVFLRHINHLPLVDAHALKLQQFENACKLIRAMPVFRLRASLNGKFWEEMEKVVSHG